ncbi:MAG: hypothetical protein ABSA32_08970 [Candidatus Acidiferrales bacterium]
MLTLPQIAKIKSESPYTYEALSHIVAAVNSIGRATGVDPSGSIAAPAPIGGISVIAADGIFDVAITNNDAGYNSSLDALARQYGTSAASVAQQSQIAFANKQQSDQLAALQGLAGLYGTNSSLLGRALGIPSDLLGVQQKAAAPSNSFNLGFGPSGLTAGIGGTI